MMRLPLIDEDTAVEGIHWATNLSSALDKAKPIHAPVFVYMTAQWCGPCGMMERNTIDQRDVQIALSLFICVNATEDAAVEGSLGCAAYPTVAFLDANGREVHRFVGYRDVESFLDEVGRANRALGIPDAS